MVLEWWWNSGEIGVEWWKEWWCNGGEMVVEWWWNGSRMVVE